MTNHEFISKTFHGNTLETLPIITIYIKSQYINAISSKHNFIQYACNFFIIIIENATMNMLIKTY
jgi:hypothetical protein